MLSKGRETGAHARPYLRNRDVQWGYVNVQDLPVMDFDSDDARRFSLLPGDVLVCEGGEVGRAAIWTGQLKECYYQKAIHRVRTSDALSPRFLRYLLEHYARTKAFERYTSGSTISHLPQEDLRNLPLPVPPRPEQDRIVAAIEEQFSRLDAGVAALEGAKERLHSLQDQSILSIIQGTGQKERLGEAAEIRLGRQRSPRNHAGPNMHPYLRAANVTWSGLNLTDVKEMNFSPSEMSTYELEAGDVLVSEASGSASEVGKPAIWDGSITDCCFQNTLLRLRSQRLTPDYLYFVLLALARSGTFARTSKGVGIHHLSKAGLAGIEVEIPPAATQRALVGVVRTQQDGLEALGSALTVALKRAHSLRTSILRAAFCGKLVSQDRSDEPASVLLERISALGASSNDHKAARVRQNPRKVTT